MRLPAIAIVAPILLCLGGCDMVVLHPAGDVAAQQRDLLLQSTALMLIVIVPVMALTILFAWRYRRSNKAARYEPDWDHSVQLELVIWGVPLLIIICLGALTWVGTHLLDPYRPVGRISAAQPVAPQAAPLVVQAVALDWKWLFLYPQYGIAVVNELAAPVDRPIAFQITASSVMNSFYIPALAGQVYAMPGMETKLHAVINKVGQYEGFSANYSGAGFSGMRFKFHGLAADAFDAWVERNRKAGGTLDRAQYLLLERPSENVPVRVFGKVDETLYDAILNMCVQPGKMCMNEMMSIDARGGLGLAGIYNILPLEYDKYARRGSSVFGGQKSAVASLCAVPSVAAGLDSAADAPPVLVAPPRLPVLGAGLSPPSRAWTGVRWSRPLPTPRPAKS